LILPENILLLLRLIDKYVRFISYCFNPILLKFFFSVLWDVYGDCKNYNVLSGHKNAVLEVKWGSDGLHIISCSADKTVGVWDANKGKRIRKFTEHTGIVNSCSIAERNPSLLISGSDDCSVILWDCRSRRSVTSLYHDYQVTSVSLSADGYSAYSGGIDNIIR